MLPGKEALYLVVSYSERALTAPVTIDPKALGFDGPYTVTNAETGQPVALDGDRFQVTLKKHDLAMFLLKPGK